VRVDGAEMCAHRWLSPRDALESLARRPILTFRPKICPIPDGACMLYPGDAGYADGDPERLEPRHRLWSLPTGYRYERTS